MTGFLDASDLSRDRFGGPLGEARPSPFQRVRQWRAERDLRRSEEEHAKVAEKLSKLGPRWRVVDWREFDDQRRGRTRMNFLTIGPGGIFSVTIRQHGRSRVLLAGDVVQVNGERPPYVAEARRNAKQAADAFSRATGVQVPVVPVLAFDGSGVLTVYGLPKGCVVTTYPELAHVLDAHGERIADSTVDKLCGIANHPLTWINPRYESLADRYRWYPSEVASDEGSPR
ncbi:MAG TPA: hypothetical protein VF054_06130 [Micromonosporaceae bacterium]